MGTSYSAKAFFGTWTPTRSDIGRKLAKYIANGTPGRTSHPDVVADIVGNAPMGEEWLVVRIKGIGASASRDDIIVAPVALEEDKPGKSGLIIAAWLREEGIDPADMAPIGWHFAATCM